MTGADLQPVADRLPVFRGQRRLLSEVNKQEAGAMDLSAGDTAWVLTAAALVLLMTPGVAFFYGGMVRVKSVLNMMMLCFGTMGVVSWYPRMGACACTHACVSSHVPLPAVRACVCRSRSSGLSSATV